MKKNKQLKLKKRANSGDIEAIYEYGMLLYHETTDYVGALKYLLKAASNNYELAFGDIATILYREKNDVNSAEKWFEKAVKASCLLASVAYEYGMLLYLERGDNEEALKYLFKALDGNYELAYGDIGTIFYREKNDVDGAEKWFEKAEKANCLLAPAAYDYGMLLYLERGDDEKALNYLLKAANDEYDLAYGDVGEILYREKNDIDSAEKWFKKAEEANTLMAPASYEYGMLLINERGDNELGSWYLKKASGEDY